MEQRQLRDRHRIDVFAVAPCHQSHTNGAASFVIDLVFKATE